MQPSDEARNGRDQWWGWGPASCPWLVADFELDHAAELVLELAARGVFVEPWLDGRPATDELLLPANSPLEMGHVVERVSLGEVAAGRHTLGLWAGGGYNADYCIWGWRWLERPRFMARLSGPDGGQVDLGPWRWAASSVLGSHIYDGELCDARRDVNWCAPQPEWAPCEPLPAPAGVELERITPPVKAVREWPGALTPAAEGVWRVDLGQNIAGRLRLVVEGDEGVEVMVRHAEETCADGRLDVRTNRGAEATDRFVLGGAGVHVLEPRFAHHGFRHAEVLGAVRLVEATGREIRACLTERGRFECSDELVNQLWHNNRSSVAANAMSFPTDTPTRDERTPPPLDVLSALDAAMLDFDMVDFYTGYLRWHPTWPTQPDMGGCTVSLPWALYRETGEVAVLGDHLGVMDDWLHRTEGMLEDGRWPDGGPDSGRPLGETGYGDWAAPHPPERADFGEGGPVIGDYAAAFTEVSLVNQALLVHQARQLALAAAVVEDGSELHHRALDRVARLQVGFHEAHWRGNGYGSGRQVTAVLPLALDLVPEGLAPRVGSSLARAIARCDDHLDTGIFGTRYLLDALARVGLDELGPVMLGQPTYPGPGFQIARGATTCWEQWCVTGPMVSHNHAMFAGLNASLYTTWAGLQNAGAGWSAVLIDPHIPAGIDMVSASIETPRGALRARWWRETDELCGELELPVAGTLWGQHLPAGRHRVRR